MKNRKAQFVMTRKLLFLQYSYTVRAPERSRAMAVQVGRKDVAGGADQCPVPGKQPASAQTRSRLGSWAGRLVARRAVSAW